MSDDNGNPFEMREGFAASVFLHVAVVFLLIVGLPHIKRDEIIIDEPPPIEVEVIADKSNPPKGETRQKQPEPEKPVEEVKPEPPKPQPTPEPPKPEPPKPEPPKPQPTPTPPVEDSIPVPKEKPEPPKKPEEPKKVEQPSKLAEVKPKTKPEPPKKNEFDDLLKTVEKFKQTNPDQDTKKNVQQQTPVAQKQGVKDGVPADKATLAEKDMIRVQVEKNWAVDPGAKGAEDLVVTIRVTMLPDGTVSNAEVVHDAQYAGNPYYRAAADAARRAVKLSSPLKYPTDKYDTFKEMELRFNPRDMIR